MQIFESADVSSKAKRNFNPDYNIKAFYEPDADDIIDQNKFIVTKEATHPENEKGRCFSCKQKIGEEHDVNCETIRKVLNINLIDWFQIAVPNYYNEKDIIDKVESISEAIYIFIDKHLREKEGNNFIDVGSEIGDVEIAGPPHLDENIRLFD